LILRLMVSDLRIVLEGSDKISLLGNEMGGGSKSANSGPKLDIWLELPRERRSNCNLASEDTKLFVSLASVLGLILVLLSSGLCVVGH